MCLNEVVIQVHKKEYSEKRRNMKNKLILCKSCNKEIAKNAKTCPHCGAKNKKKHYWLIAIIAIIILACIIAAGDSDEPQKVDSPNKNGASQNINQNSGDKDQNNNKNTVFFAGDTAQLKNILVTFINVSESTGSAYNKPAEGNVFVICEFEITNNSKEEITVSSIMNFDAYCDDYACSLSLSAMIDNDDKNQLDGTVAAGKKLRGIIGYEVPAEWKELEVRYTPDIWSEKEIIFVAYNR